MKKNLTNKWKKLYIILGSLIFILITILIINNVKYSKQYINGNVLNLPVVNKNFVLEYGYLSPWREHEISSTLMHRALFIADSTLLNVSPDLAKSYEISEDGKTYTIVLKEDNYWSDGTLITPDDVVFTIKAISKSENVNHMLETVIQYIDGSTEYKNGEADEISGIDIDGNTITINLHTKYNTFLPIMAQLTLVPHHILKDEDIYTITDNDFWKDPVTSGMYRLDELINDGESHYFRLLKNEYYTEEMSDIDEVRIHFPESRKTLDYTATNNTRTMTTYNNATNYEGYDVDMILHRFFVCNISGDNGNYNAVMDDIRVRQAILYAIDRESILSYVYMNVGEVVNSGIVESNPANNGFTHEYNPKKSVELLNEAGYDFDRPIVITYDNDDAQNITFLSRVSNNLEEIGLKVELFRIGSKDEKYSDREFDLLLSDEMVFNDNAWYSLYDNNNLYHISFFDIDNEFNGLFKGLRESPDEDTRTQYLKHLQELEQEKLYMLPMFSLSQVVYIQNQRLSVPEDIKFGSPVYRYDIKLSEWEIKKE